MKQLTRQIIIEELRQYFKPEELVCPHTIKRFGDNLLMENGWFVLRTESLHTLLILRTEILKVPLICNTYLWDTNPKTVKTERGHRCNLCSLVLDKSLNQKNKNYLSGHIMGAAWDLTSAKMAAEEMRKKIKENKHLLPYNIRIEKNVTWLHIDTYDFNTKIFEF